MSPSQTSPPLVSLSISQEQKVEDGIFPPDYVDFDARHGRKWQDSESRGVCRS